ncbi:glutamate mutase L [Desulfosporosinus nitroreducens]|uniref:Glutamate mutase L n=1 Tax=Desulfosporosinus nitroreducens TaxID=2018668 RepID=A0ABT8R1B3_9FIRM|nr:glutamate mutase L [Desulfosporosinus nitroreducens]MCO1603522.1 glutamate mutase L [Desulfosporosinus nitroreducens]MDO0825916.1 glutamate mutase L [Desulfosporosinus nitroreducens]
MQKVLVAEIGNETIVVKAFANLDTENPLLLGQGISLRTEYDGDFRTGLQFAVTDLEKDIGPIGCLGDIPFYGVSSVPKIHTMKVNGAIVLRGGFLPATEAIMNAAKLIYEEVGEVLVLDVGAIATNLYSLTSGPVPQRTVEEDLGVLINPLPLVRLIGENRIVEHHGEEWEKLITSRPETPEQMVFSAEITSAAITIALKRHSGVSGNCGPRDLSNIRWIVGTGVALTQLPNGLEIFRESIMGMEGTLFSEEKIAILLDKDCIMSSLGSLAATYRKAAWQLMRESFGVEN